MSVVFSKFEAIKRKVKEEKATYKTEVISVKCVCSPSETIRGLLFRCEMVVKVYLSLSFFYSVPVETHAASTPHRAKMISQQ